MQAENNIKNAAVATQTSTPDQTSDYYEYTVKNSTEPSFYGSKCTQEDATRIASAISQLIRNEFPGINVEEWQDGNASSKTTGPDEAVIEDINEWISNNWTAAL